MTDLNLLVLFDALVAPQDLSLGSGNGKGVTLSPLLSEIFANALFFDLVDPNDGVHGNKRALNAIKFIAQAILGRVY